MSLDNRMSADRSVSSDASGKVGPKFVVNYAQWKSREDFILRLWMKDKVYEFPFSMPPTEGDVILRKRDE